MKERELKIHSHKKAIESYPSSLISSVQQAEKTRLEGEERTRQEADKATTADEATVVAPENSLWFICSSFDIVTKKRSSEWIATGVVVR